MQKLLILPQELLVQAWLANKSILFEPQTDLAVANAICYEIVNNGWVNKSFVEKHCNFSKGLTNIGYGTEDKFNFKDVPEGIRF